MRQEGEAPDLGEDTQDAIRHFSEGRLPQAKVRGQQPKTANHLPGPTRLVL